MRSEPFFPLQSSPLPFPPFSALICLGRWANSFTELSAIRTILPPRPPSPPSGPALGWYLDNDDSLQTVSYIKVSLIGCKFGLHDSALALSKYMQWTVGLLPTDWAEQNHRYLLFN